MTDCPCRFLEWDSDFFGFRIATVTDSELTRDTLGRIVQWCAQERIRCLYLLARGDDRETAELAGGHGFRFVDIRAEYGCSLEGQQDPVQELRRAMPGDIPALTQIARCSHTDSRFYFDGQFPRERCDELYSTWIEKSCRGYAKAVLVAECDGKPAGYVTGNWNGQSGQIGLLAVADWARGRGLGRTLVRSALQLFREQGIQTVKVVTQGRNIESQRLYAQCGFSIASVNIWYHRWFPDNEGRENRAK